MEQFLRFPLPFGNRLARALDVRARAIVIALEEDDARPDIDRLFVFGCEVMIKTGDEKFFDARRALGVVRRWRRAESVRCGSVINR